MILKYFLIFWLAPGIAGTLIVKNQNRKWLYSYVAGMLLMLSTFQAVILPCVFLRTSLSQAVGIWSFVFVSILICLAIKNNQVIRGLWKELGLKKKLKEIDASTIIVFVLVFFQVFMLARYAHYDADDALFVGAATTAWDTDSLFRYDSYTGDLIVGFHSRYVFSPFPMFLAAVSRIIGCHPAILAHTMLPTVFIPMAYMVYALIGNLLFDRGKLKNELFLVLISIMGIFSFWSAGYFQQAFLLLRIWQGKAILAGVLLPMLFYMILKYWVEKYRACDWIILFCLMVSTTLVSSMGIILGAIELGILGIMVLVIRRDIKAALQLCACAVPNIVLSLCYLAI